MNSTQKGTVISVQEPWLSVSPDGIIDSYASGNKMLPSLTDQLSQKCRNIKLVDGELQPQKNGSG